MEPVDENVDFDVQHFDHPYTKSCFSVCESRYLNKEDQCSTVLNVSGPACSVESVKQVDDLDDFGLNFPSFQSVTMESNIISPNIVEASILSILNDDLSNINLPNIIAIPEDNSSVISGPIAENQLPLISSDDKSVSSINSHTSNTMISPTNDQTVKCEGTTGRLSQYSGMFSVEQHFVCLACCTCFKTDSALVIHLQIHIANQVHVSKVNIPSNIKVHQSDQVMAVSKGFCHTKPDISNSDSYNLPDALLGGNVDNCDDGVCVPVDLYLIGSTEQNELPSLADGTGHQRAASCGQTRELSDYICSICLSHFTNFDDLQVHLKQHNISKELSGDVTKIKKMKPINEDSETSTLTYTTEPVLSFTVDGSSLSVVCCVDEKSSQLFTDDTSNDMERKSSVSGVQMRSLIPNGIGNVLKNNTAQLDVSSTAGTLTNSENAEKSIPSLDNQPHICECCEKVFSNKNLYRRHMSRMHYGYGSTVKAMQIRYSKQQVCEFCGKVFPDRKLYRQHVKSMHPSNYKDVVIPVVSNYFNEPQICEGCSKVFSYRSLYLRHIRRMHPNIKPYKCNECEQSFFYSVDLIDHEKVHTAYKCLVCDITFSEISLFDKHQEEHKGDKHSESFRCHFCRRLCKTSYSLERHQRTCLAEKIYTCVFCQKQFALQSQLNSHVKYHGDGKIKCNVCQKAFLFESTLRRHMRRHTGNRSQVCDECTYTCVLRGDMIRHKRRHSAEKAFCCTLCSKCFKVSGSLAEHMATHTGQQYSKCKLCPAEFNLRKKLTRHMKKKHPLEAR